MALDPRITLTLDREREILWTTVSSPKLGRLEDPPPLHDIFHRNPHRAFFAFLAWLWAAVEDPGQDFARPEALADYFQTPAQQAAGFAALIQALRQAGVLKPEKKTAPITSDGAAKSPAAALSTSNGPRPSSSSAPRARPLKGSRRSSSAT